MNLEHPLSNPETQPVGLQEKFSTASLHPWEVEQALQGASGMIVRRYSIVGGSGSGVVKAANQNGRQRRQGDKLLGGF